MARRSPGVSWDELRGWFDFNSWSPTARGIGVGAIIVVLVFVRYLVNQTLHQEEPQLTQQQNRSSQSSNTTTSRRTSPHSSRARPKKEIILADHWSRIRTPAELGLENEAAEAAANEELGDLPVATVADWTSVRRPTRTSPQVGIKVESQRELPVDSIPLPEGNLHRLAFAGNSSAFVAYQATDIPQEERATKPSQVQALDLMQGKSKPYFALPAGTHLYAASPSGQYLVALTGPDRKRVDIYRENGEHLTAWLPYRALEFNPHHDPAQGFPSQSVAWAAFVDDEHLLTVNHRQPTLVGWKLPECRAEFILPLHDAGRPALTRDRRYLACWGPERVIFRDALTGDAKGHVELPEGEVFPSNRIFFSGRGNTMFALSEQSTFWEVKLSQGEVVRNGKLPFPGTHLRQIGSDRLLIRNEREAKLFDLERQIILWNYAFPQAQGQSGPFALIDHTQLSGSQSVAVRKPSVHQAGTLETYQLPSLNESAEIRRAFPPNQTLAFDAVSLEVNCPGAPFEVGPILRTMEIVLKREGVQVKPDAPVRWEFRSEVLKTERMSFIGMPSPPRVSRQGGKTVIRPGSSGGSVEVNVPTIKLSIAMIHEDGRTIWSSERTFKLIKQTSYRGTEATFQQMGDRIWYNMHEYLLNFSFPTEVLRQPLVNGNPEEPGLGTTNL